MQAPGLRSRNCLAMCMPGDNSSWSQPWADIHQQAYLEGLIMSLRSHCGHHSASLKRCMLRALRCAEDLPPAGDATAVLGELGTTDIYQLGIGPLVSASWFMGLAVLPIGAIYGPLYEHLQELRRSGREVHAWLF